MVVFLFISYAVAVALPHAFKPCACGALDPDFGGDKIKIELQRSRPLQRTHRVSKNNESAVAHGHNKDETVVKLPDDLTVTCKGCAPAMCASSSTPASGVTGTRAADNTNRSQSTDRPLTSPVEQSRPNTATSSTRPPVQKATTTSTQTPSAASEAREPVTANGTASRNPCADTAAKRPLLGGGGGGKKGRQKV